MYKFIKLIIIIMTTTAISANAQKAENKKYREIKETKVSPVINVDAAELWNIIGPGFSDVSKWSRAVDHATTSGDPTFEGASCSNRYCDLNASGFNKISETIIEYNENDRKLGYTVDSGLPGFVTYMANNWRVIEVGPGQSKAEMNITMRMKPFMGFLMGGLFKMNVNKVLKEVIEDLKIYAETGEVSEAKKARIKKLEKKQA